MISSLQHDLPTTLAKLFNFLLGYCITHTHIYIHLPLSLSLSFRPFTRRKGETGRQRKNGGGFCSRWKLRNTGPGIMATAEIIVSRTASSVFNRAFRLCFGCLIFRITIRGFAGGRNNVRHSWFQGSNALSLSLSHRDRSCLDFVYYSRRIYTRCSNRGGKLQPRSTNFPVIMAGSRDAAPSPVVPTLN